MTDVLLAFSLAVDCFVISITLGIRERTKLSSVIMVLIALVFGLFQAGMPAFGFVLSTTFSRYILVLDHWISFILLAGVGFLSLYDAYKKRGQTHTHVTQLRLISIFLLAIATSIDAFAVGLALPTVSSHIFVTISIIGIITSVLSFIGMRFATRIPERLSDPFEFIAAFVLIGLGCKILFQHFLL
ncbi:MAG TPA: manganese efflux pump [Patescibacteria group bacterium]|nr:manganese efflux pump [Patescibacteria group bacterium]